MEHRVNRLIHVVGTMGAGKTTLIRSWMAELSFAPVCEDGWSRPMSYHCEAPPIWVLGCYDPDLQTSGCDYLKREVELNFELAERRYNGGAATVVYEGLLMMNHTRGLALLARTRAVTVLRLMATLDECRAGVVARRAAQGNHEPLPPRFEAGLAGHEVRARNYAFKMKQAGAEVIKVTREEALPRLRALTG